MSEFFLELFSEEIPPNLQIDAREKIRKFFEASLNKNDIEFKLSKSYSTPNRLVFFINGIPKKIKKEEKILKGPNINAPKIALEGFLKSNNLNQSDIFEKELDKGKFFVKRHTKLMLIFLNLIKKIFR